MKIKQELLDSGFIVRVKTEDLMLIIINYFGLESDKYNFQDFFSRTCLRYNCGDLTYSDEQYCIDKYQGEKIYDYNDIWDSKLMEFEERTINAKESIISLILDKQLSFGKRFDKFIDDLPVDNEMLIDFIFEDGDLLLQEVFGILSYLNCQINIEECKQ